MGASEVETLSISVQFLMRDYDKAEVISSQTECGTHVYTDPLREVENTTLARTAYFDVIVKAPGILLR